MSKGIPPANKLYEKELKDRRKIIIEEIKRVSRLLNKPLITQSDFMLNSNITFPRHAFLRVFGNFTNALDAAGLKKPDSNFYIKREQLKKLFKQIALKHGNKLSLPILLKETGKSYTDIYQGKISPYFGGVFNLCKIIRCEYVTNKPFVKTAFENYIVNDKQSIGKEKFKESMISMAKLHENSLSREILLKNSSLSKTTLENYTWKWFGGFEKMCESLGIIWIKGNHGIDLKELDILKDIRLVYRDSGNKISRSIYTRHGKYNLEAIEDYFGSFGKACLEVNIRTEAMKANVKVAH